MNEEPSKLKVAVGSVGAGLIIAATVAVIVPVFIVGFILNIPKALDALDGRIGEGHLP